MSKRTNVWANFEDTFLSRLIQLRLAIDHPFSSV